MAEDQYTKREHDLIFNELREAILRIEKKVDGIGTEQEKQGAEINKRVFLLELWRENAVGKISVISILVGMGITAAFTWITKHF